MYEDSLYHYGILGQKWGVRRFQNPDGSLTPKGRKHYRNDVERATKKAEKKYYKALNKVNKKYGIEDTNGLNDYVDDKVKTDKRKTAIKVGAAIVGTALVAYGGYKLTTSPKAKSITSKVLHGTKNKTKTVSQETNKLASEASALARSVIAEGPKNFTRAVQYPSRTVVAPSSVNNQKSSLQWQQAQRTDRKIVANTIKIHGQEKFNAASKANDDLLQELLKKNKINF